jgi:hypothetical protein
MYENLIGKNVNEVRDFLKENQIPSRVVNIDGVPFMLTNDYNPARLNLSVENGLVTEVILG